MQFSTLTAALCLLSAAMAAPQGFISQERCAISGQYTCGQGNQIFVCNGAGKWVVAAACGAAKCQTVGGVPQPH